ncbi:NUDIX hydrolase [Candidatus Dojkabacteria bacterium]|nr:NUDIX hydrolase [Candidatus Dojkabacteria bacterium]
MIDNFQKFHISLKTLIKVEKEFLLLKVSTKYKFGGRIDFPGGRVDNDENFENVMQRELKEEINYDFDIKKLEIIAVNQRFNYGFYKENKICLCEIIFLLNLETKPVIQISPEHEEYYWINSETDLNQFDYKDDNQKNLIIKFQQEYCK